MIIPIGINAATGKEITFTTVALNLPIAIKVFLEDRFTNTFTRLDETNSEYKVTLTEALNGVGRFYLHTARNVLSTENILLNSVHIYKTDAATLKITGLLQGKTSFYLYNILGKAMMTALFESNGNKEISLSKLASGIYFVKIQTEKGAITKKIILE
jgi:ABC-type siderophore export system fused ATPase/permease subunit